MLPAFSAGFTQLWYFCLNFLGNPTSRESRNAAICCGSPGGRSAPADKIDLPGPPGLSASAKITATQPGLPGSWERSDGLLGHPRTCLGVPAARPGRRTVRCWVPEASVPALALPLRSGAAGRGGAAPCLRLLNPEPELRSASLCGVSRYCPYHFRLPEGRRVPLPSPGQPNSASKISQAVRTFSFVLEIVNGQ